MCFVFHTLLNNYVCTNILSKIEVIAATDFDELLEQMHLEALDVVDSHIDER